MIPIIPVRGAPLPMSWEGLCVRKPWDYEVTAVVPCVDLVDELEVCVELLRLQTNRPYIVVVDTGSEWHHAQRIERLRAADLEVHQIRSNGVQHPSQLVSVAMDLAFSLCVTPYLFATHQDCFLRNRNFLKRFVGEMRDGLSVYGYSVTERWHSKWRQDAFGHTATMFDMAQMRRIGAGWSMIRLADTRGYSRFPEAGSWPDTETLINEQVREAGLKVKLICGEKNYERFVDEHVDHCRSLPGAMLYSQELFAKQRIACDLAMNEARARIKLWKKENENE